MIPSTNPDSLEESLKIFENIRYKSSGFPIVWLDYNYTFKHWGMAFRNSVNFSNPEIKEDTPLKAVHKMLDFLREIKAARETQDETTK